MLRDLLAVKPIEPTSGTAHHGAGVTLKRCLSARHLVVLGIGAIIGAGIFVLTGQAAAMYTGPAIVLSFVLAGLACAFAGLCYAEFASLLPVSGSAYSYSYATLGEGAAWFVGWMLVLEYLVSSATVAVGWSGYLTSFLGTLGVPLPSELTTAPFAYSGGSLSRTGAFINLPAISIVVAITALCYAGITQSAFVNSIAVAIKLTVILLFIAFAIRYVNPDNWLPFIPENSGTFGHFGVSGVLRGASVVFFAYIGFDAVSTAAGEAKNPQRDMPIAILGSLVICTLLYIVVAGMLTGLLPYPQLATPKPVATALEAYPSLIWLKTIVEIGAIAGLSSVILVLILAQPRIFYTMSQDGLLPKFFSRLHPKHRTPHVGTLIVGGTAATLAGLLPIGVLGDLVSMGTLLAFATVCVGVLILRRTRPDLPRPFKVRFLPLISACGTVACAALFLMAFKDNWHWMSAWIVLGWVLYFAYGYRHSSLRAQSSPARERPTGP